MSWLHLGHIFSILVENTEDILTIERFENCVYLLKLKENPEMSASYTFIARRIQVLPSVPFEKKLKEVSVS